MIALPYAPTTGIARLKSELLTVDPRTFNGVASPGKAGVKYPLPPAAYAELPVIQIIAWPRELYNDKGNAPRVRFGTSLISIRDIHGGWILYDHPLELLDPGFATPSRRLAIRPQVIDCRKSYITPTANMSEPWIIELVYTQP